MVTIGEDILHWKCPTENFVDWLPASAMFNAINTGQELSCEGCGRSHDPNRVDMVQLPIQSIMDDKRVS